MNVVDLSGRQDEPAIRTVLDHSHGSTEALEQACAKYRSREWTFKLRRRMLDGEPAPTVEADSIVIGLRNYPLRRGALGKCVHERAAKTAVSPRGRNRNRADPDRAAAELLCSGAGENLSRGLPSDECPFSGPVVSTCLIECLC